MTTTMSSQPAVAPETADRGRSVARLGSARIHLLVLLLGTAVLYLWNLSSSGYANTFYAAAAQAGGNSWKGWFFGSLDQGNFMTVDKPPASMWVDGLSVRIFGMNSWAVLAPQALIGVASVALAYATARRIFADRAHGHAAGLLAGAVLALTPSAALIFRFNNPDALMVLLMVAGGYFLARAVATNSGRWLAMVGVALGFAFLTKMLQGFLVLPAFALAYLVYANVPWRKRIVHLLGAAAALVVSAGWFPLVTILVPASDRPYIDGSTNNTFMDLVFGYNGIDRISGSAPGGGGPGGGGPGGGGGAAGSSFGGSTGLDRLFGSEMGNEVSWMIPTALVALAFSLYLLIRGWRNAELPGRLSRPETAGVIAWAGWFVVTALIFSYMTGTIHPYYTVALAPAIGLIIGMGAIFAWRRRTFVDGRVALGAMVAAGAVTAIVLLNRNDYGPVWCRVLIGVAAAVSVIGIIVPQARHRRASTAAVVAVGVAAALGGTTAFAIATAATAHSGGVPTAVQTSQASGGFGGGGFGGGPGGGNGQRGGGGGGEGQSDSAVTALLKSSTATWSAAVEGSQTAGPLEIASGKAVMAIGGFDGDAAPTLNQFIALVHGGKIGYYIAGGQGGFGGGQDPGAAPGAGATAQKSGTAPTGRARGGPGGGRGNSGIAQWVAAHYKATTVGTSTVYKLN